MHTIWICYYTPVYIEREGDLHFVLIGCVGCALTCVGAQVSVINLWITSNRLLRQSYYSYILIGFKAKDKDRAHKLLIALNL